MMAVTTWRVRRRSAIAVAVLTLSTIGLYGLIWTGLTWSQLRQLTGDRRLHPFAHALSLLVPIYCFFRFDAHVRTLNKVAVSAGVDSRMHRGVSIALLAFAWFLLSPAHLVITLPLYQPSVLIAISVAGLLVLSGVIGWGQWVMNRVIDASSQSEAVRGLHPLEHGILALVAAALSWDVAFRLWQAVT